MIALAVITTAALAVILIIAVGNHLHFPRLRAEHVAAEPRLVSVLIPARDEADAIADTVEALLKQSYRRLEIVVLDDESDDGTAEAALRAGQGDSRLRVAHGAPLPPGWLGKNWACHQLARRARGDLMVFTDADVFWQPDALAALAALVEDERADLLTVWPTQLTVTWAERLAVPLMALSVLGYLPVGLAHDSRWPLAAAANGQCLAFRAAAYRRCGGHAAVRHSVVEDISLARRVKAAGLRFRMADGNGLILCRMYRGWQEVVNGYAKNILAGHGSSLPFLALSTAFHLALFVWPWLWLAAGPDSSWGPHGWPIWPLALIALGLGTRAITAAATHQRRRDALLMPLSALLMTFIAARAVWWHFGPGPTWKGRTLDL